MFVFYFPRGYLSVKSMSPRHVHWPNNQSPTSNNKSHDLLWSWQNWQELKCRSRIRSDRSSESVIPGGGLTVFVPDWRKLLSYLDESAFSCAKASATSDDWEGWVIVFLDTCVRLAGLLCPGCCEKLGMAVLLSIFREPSRRAAFCPSFWMLMQVRLYSTFYYGAVTQSPFHLWMFYQKTNCLQKAMHSEACPLLAWKYC